MSQSRPSSSSAPSDLSLSQADAQAVDVLLDRPADAVDTASPAAPASTADAPPPAPAGGDHDPVSMDAPPSGTHALGLNAGPAFTMSADDDLPDRIDAVDGLLKLLDHLPSGDPAGDLVQRTMHRVTAARDQASSVGASAGAAVSAAASLGAPPSVVPNQSAVMKDDAPESV